MQAHILYSGFVQGVGFRYTVDRCARNLCINGWVKNLHNGSVEIVAEGSKSQIKSLCQEIESHFSANIREKELTFDNSPSRYNDFQIRV